MTFYLTEAQASRFRLRIKSTSAPNEAGCWLWQKSLSRNGYSRFALGGGLVTGGHRAAFAAFHGPIPAKMDVCHRCDVRSCVNPEHLFLGTRAENIADAAAKGRLSHHHQKKGEDHPSAKLDDARVREIVAKLKSGRSKKSLSSEYGVSQRVILLIARGQAWKHVTGGALT